MQRFRKFQRLLPSIRVHIWGGLGSQLFGLLAANRLKARWPNRRIALVFHSSGVTQRFMELRTESTIGFKIIQKHDFNADHPQEVTLGDITPSYINSMRQMLKSLLLCSRFLETLNTDIEFSNVRPWLFSVRGHYAGLSILPSEVRWIAQLIDLDSSPSLSVGVNTCIHLRLGDLLNLENKSYIPIERIYSLPEISKANKTILVYSDSEASVTESLWRSHFTLGSFTFLSLDIYQTLRECVSSPIFIGTNSKVSLWIVAMRLGLNIGYTSYLPRELENYAKETLIELNENSNFSLY